MLSDNIIMLPVDLFYFACKGQKYASIQFIHTVVCINVVRIYFILPYVLYVRLSDIQRNILLLSYCKFWIYWVGVNAKFTIVVILLIQNVQYMTTIWHYIQNIWRHSAIGGDKLVADVVENFQFQGLFSIHLFQALTRTYLSGINKIHTDAKH